MLEVPMGKGEKLSFKLTSEERRSLKKILQETRHFKLLEMKARALLLCSSGLTDEAAAKQLGLKAPAIARWKREFRKNELKKHPKENPKNKQSVTSSNSDDLSILQTKLGYQFKDPSLLENAITHTSFVNEKKLSRTSANERLEFLGDSVLGLAICSELIEMRPDSPEGVLSKLRSGLVNEYKLSEIAKQIGLGDFLLLGRGEFLSGGREKPSMLADAYEALIAAIYIDGGFEKARCLVSSHFKDCFKNIDKIALTIDSKTRVQELSQEAFKIAPVYVVTSVCGPEHDKVFTVEARLRGEVIGRGSGRSKREAEQKAATEAEGPLRLKIESIKKPLQSSAEKADTGQ